jgi:hypothetical protein
MAGVFCWGGVQEKKWKKLKIDLEVDLPHQRFAKTIKDSSPKFNRQRLEGVWHIRLDKLESSQHNMQWVHLYPLTVVKARHSHFVWLGRYIKSWKRLPPCGNTEL